MAKKTKKTTDKKFGKKLLFLLDIEPYKQQCLIVCNGLADDAIDWFKKHGKNENAKETLEHFAKYKSDYSGSDYKIGRGTARLWTELPHGYVMLISHTNNWKETVGLVVHESLHLTHYILRRAGIELTKDSEESFTYLQEMIVTNILKRIY